MNFLVQAKTAQEPKTIKEDNKMIQSLDIISDRQYAILKIISRSLNSRGYPPTLREIGNEIGIKSTSTVAKHLRTLENNGYIKRNPSKSRCIEIKRQEILQTTATQINIYSKKDTQEKSMVLPESIGNFKKNHKAYTVDKSIFKNDISAGDLIIIDSDYTELQLKDLIAIENENYIIVTQYNPSIDNILGKIICVIKRINQ